MRELVFVAAVAGCAAPAAPSRPTSSCRLQPIEDLAIGELTDARLRCALPSGSVRVDGTTFAVILPSKQPAWSLLGPTEPGLALETGGDLGRTFAVYSPEVTTRLGLRVGSTLAEVRAVVGRLDCDAFPATSFMSCSSPLDDTSAAAGFVFYLRGAIAFDDNQVTDLDRHAAATVAYFHYSARPPPD